MPGPTFTSTSDDDYPQANALLTLEVAVEEEWIDYNGHMTEWQYYKTLADAGENFLRAMGFTEEYRLQGYSFFSVEGHQRNLKECRTGTPLSVYTEMIGFDAVRLHIYQYIVDKKRNIVVATGEHMMVHVDTTRRSATPVNAYMESCLGKALAKWGALKAPKGLTASIRRLKP